MSSLEKIKSVQLLKILNEFQKSSILVLGDIILDCYVWGEVERICPEAPVPVVEVKRDSLLLGGAANVVANLWSLGARVSLCGVIGEDRSGEEVQKKLLEMNISREGLIIEKERQTSQKTRVIARHQQVVRFDHETKKHISSNTLQNIFRYLEKNWDAFDAVIISDYGKGVIHPELFEKVLLYSRRSPKLLSVDPKERNMEFYKRVSLITPNKKEASFAVSKTIDSDDDLKEAGRKIIHQLQCENLVITLGAEGMALFTKEGKFLKMPTFAREVFDVSGAGDTVVSVLTLSLCSGATLGEACALANYAAGVVVGKVGTASATLSELKEYIQVEKKRISPRNFTIQSSLLPTFSLK